MAPLIWYCHGTGIVNIGILQHPKASIVLSCFCAFSLEDVCKHNWVIRPLTLKVSGERGIQMLYLIKYINARL